MAQRAEAPKDLKDVAPAQRAKLEVALKRLREAAAAYEPFLGRRLVDGEVPAHNADELKRAQDELVEAEENLWRLRREILGWARPARGVSATQAVEWILEEDD